MIGVYFSGTGNSKYFVENFLQEYDAEAAVFSIENKELLKQIGQHEEIVFGYPVQYSNMPKIVKDFIINHQSLWKGKRIFLSCSGSIGTEIIFCQQDKALYR